MTTRDLPLVALGCFFVAVLPLVRFDWTLAGAAFFLLTGFGIVLNRRGEVVVRVETPEPAVTPEPVGITPDVSDYDGALTREEQQAFDEFVSSGTVVEWNWHNARIAWARGEGYSGEGA